MTKSKVYWVTGLLAVALSSTGCGQKGPLYLDKTPDNTAKRVESEDQERKTESEELKPRNDSRPDITY